MGDMDLTVDQKFAKVVIALRDRRPFYSAVYETMPHIKSESVPSIGVNSSQLLYNEKFVDERPFNEFMFIILHEVAHISLMHPCRGTGKDHTLFNIACDLYVNALLAEEFGITPGGEDASRTVKMPEDGMYCSSIDLDVDYVEDIYEKLVQQGKENGYFNDTEGKHEFTYKGSKENNSGGNSGYGYNYSYGRDDYDKHKEFHITVDTKYVSDLIDDGKDQLQKENDNKKIMAEAKMKHEMMDKSAGNSSSRLQFEVEALLNSKVDWKRLLRKYCIVHRMSDTSFNTPDKRMHYQSAIYPGLISENELVLDNVKLCVDTSGSMSDDDIGNVIGQVVDLTKQFKTTAELISWDASVESTQMIDSKTIRPAKKSHLAGRGGTDPRCLFEYFDSKQCKIKPFVTIIFTDGFIYSDEFKPKWTRKYKNTIWIMTRDYNSSFVPPFGKVAYADFSRASKR